MDFVGTVLRFGRCQSVPVCCRNGSYIARHVGVDGDRCQWRTGVGLECLNRPTTEIPKF
jgi:hypothetical protein